MSSDELRSKLDAARRERWLGEWKLRQWPTVAGEFAGNLSHANLLTARQIEAIADRIQPTLLQFYNFTPTRFYSTDRTAIVAALEAIRDGERELECTLLLRDGQGIAGIRAQTSELIPMCEKLCVVDLQDVVVIWEEGRRGILLERQSHDEEGRALPTCYLRTWGCKWT
ncbi:MAG: hypothetical protein IPK83_08360 [Planctomycetes bacterium]|nr:hypothetical protein [Planctomycetota bacterium]